MTKPRFIIIIGSGIILAQILLFRNYLTFPSDQIIIEGQRCTCPNARVKSGEAYLKTITPDSLIKYNLDYSEIYFKNDISNASDPMGVNQYIITGQIIGKGSVSEVDGHNYPLFRIDHYRDAFLYNIIKWIIRAFLIIEILVLVVIVRKKVTLITMHEKTK
jgi:hypothetical protein